MPAGAWIFGFNPYLLASLWRGQSLTWMGRIADGLEELRRCARLAEEDRTPEVALYAIYYAAEAGCHAHDADRGLASARQLEVLSRTLGDPPAFLAMKETAFAFAHLAAGRPADAIEPARAALAVYRRLEQQMVGVAATTLAEALLQAGDLTSALAAAEEAIALCGRTLRATYEAEAHGVLARALLRRDGVAARNRAEAALASAAALIERCGARTLAPALSEWRAEVAAVLGNEVTREKLLREAQRGYEEIGATDYAARLAAELSA
jgi:hypothetical protein